MSILSDLKKTFKIVIKAAYPDLKFEENLIDVTYATQKNFGHYQLNSAMKMVKFCKTNPREIAKNIIDALQKSPEYEAIFKKAEIAGPGFINLHLKDSYLEKKLDGVFPRVKFPSVGGGGKVVVDFSSPNIAKEMHVGHLRSTIIGDCLAHILEACGYDVLRLNHVGDWGTAFGMLIAYMKGNIPDKQEKGASLQELVQWYKKSKEKFDSDLKFKKEAQLEVVALQRGDEDSLKRWTEICAISRRAYKEIYDLLDIDLIERGESFYNPMLSDVVQDFENKELVTISGGAKCVYLDGYINREGEPLPFMIQKSDGGYNYASTDIAALRHRVDIEKADRIIYVTDCGQATHFSMLFEATKKAEYWTKESLRLDHVPFGLVLGEDGKKFRTRSGEVEKLQDLLDCAIEKAKTLLDDREEVKAMSIDEREELAKALGINSVKYADLSCNRISDYKFSYERMLRFEGNTAPFLMYAYVRIQGIKRKIEALEVEKLDLSSVVITHDSERDLIIKMLRFDDAILSVVDDLYPSRLCEYLYELAETFHAFFRDCRVVGVKEQSSRLVLCEACGNILESGLQLLGLKVVSKM